MSMETRTRDPRYAAEGTPESVERAAALKVGDRVRFHGEKQARWRVRAKGDRYIVLTKPFNLGRPGYGKHHYTVIDLELGIRGTHNSYGHGAESEDAITRTLAALESDDIEISVRNNVRLEIAETRATP